MEIKIFDYIALGRIDGKTLYTQNGRKFLLASTNEEKVEKPKLAISAGLVITTAILLRQAQKSFPSANFLLIILAYIIAYFVGLILYRPLLSATTDVIEYDLQEEDKTTLSTIELANAQKALALTLVVLLFVVGFTALYLYTGFVFFIFIAMTILACLTFLFHVKTLRRIRILKSLKK